MNIPTIAALCLVAGLAASVAVAAGPNTAVAVPAAGVAVGVAALLLVSVLERTAWPPLRTRTSSRDRSIPIRAAFEEGKLGRRELIQILDSLERTGYGLAPPVLSAEELDHLVARSPEEFRRYLDVRVSELEGRT